MDMCGIGWLLSLHTQVTQCLLCVCFWGVLSCFIERRQAEQINVLFVKSACICLRMKIVPGNKWKMSVVLKNLSNNLPNQQTNRIELSSVQFSRSVVSDSLWPHESQQARPACPSPSPGVHSDSRPSSLWCHPAISSWVVPFSSCSQSLPASESFPMSQLFVWGVQRTGASGESSQKHLYLKTKLPII